MPSLPRVLFVGGPDVDARLELMRCLRGAFDLGALGARPALHDRFAGEGFGYNYYHLSRQVNPVLDLWTMSQLMLIFQKLKPQIVHAFDTKPGVWGCLAARLAGVPIVIGTVTGLGSLYSSDSWTTRSVRTLYQALQRLACHVSDRTIFQNRQDARQFIENRIVSARKAIVIPGSGVSTDGFVQSLVSDEDRARLKEELGIRPDEIVVTMISRVIRSKGVLEYGVAAREIRISCECARLVLVGAEDSESVDRLNAEELAQLKQAVTWIGPRRDIPTVFAVSDIFVLPSAYREGVPRVLLEAASMGLPIITTDSPGCNDVVEHGVNGFLVPVHDPAALSRALLSLIEQPALRQRFGQVSRQRAVERFDLSVIAAQTRSVYQHLLAHSGRMATMER